MNADEPIADTGRGGRSARLIQDVNGHFYVERDGVQGPVRTTLSPAAKRR